MNPELKQRLIGAIVVTALAAIFIPMLFEVPVENNTQSVTELGIPSPAIKPDEELIKKLPSNTKQVLKPSESEPEEPNESLDEPEQSVRPSAAIDTELVDDADVGTEDSTNKTKMKSSRMSSSTRNTYDVDDIDEHPVIEPIDENGSATLDTGIVKEATPTKKSVSLSSKQAQASKTVSGSRDNVAKENKNQLNKANISGEKVKSPLKTAQTNSSRQASVNSNDTGLTTKTRLPIKSPETNAFKPASTKQIETGVPVKTKPNLNAFETNSVKQTLAKPVNNEITVKTKPPLKKPEDINTRQQATVKSSETEQSVKIRPPAQVKKTEVTPSKLAQTIAPSTIATLPKTEKTTKTNIDTKPLPELNRWYVHVGSFSQKENAFSLLETLNQQGLPVILETIKTQNKGSMYRIKIGPELDKKRADAIKAKLDKQNIKTNVIAN